MKKILIPILVILSVILVVFDLSKYFTENKHPLSGLKLKDVDSIIIRTQMTEERPEQKILKDKNEISEVIEFLKNVDYEKIGECQGDKGWAFWIAINDFDISFLGTGADINGEIFEIDSDTTMKFMKVYENLNSPSLKFP